MLYWYMLIMKMNVHVHCQNKTTNHSYSCIIVAYWKWHPVYESPSPPQRGIWVNITTCRLTGLWHCCVQDLQWTPAWDIDRWHHLYLSLSTHLWRTCNTEDKVCTESKAKELSMGSELIECEIISDLGMWLAECWWWWLLYGSLESVHPP